MEKGYMAEVLENIIKVTVKHMVELGCDKQLALSFFSDSWDAAESDKYDPAQ